MIGVDLECFSTRTKANIFRAKMGGFIEEHETFMIESYFLNDQQDNKYAVRVYEAPTCLHENVEKLTFHCD
jgi:hypothetical protein